MRYRLTLLEQMRVVRDDGTDVGRLMDLRTRATIGPMPASETLAVDALLLGAGGWLERMGFKESDNNVQPNAVVAVERDRVIVRTRKEARASGSRKRSGRR
jgi:sporulation protein YlmC with PRC-barrel domain